MAESERQNAKSFGDVVPVVDIAHHPGSAKYGRSYNDAPDLTTNSE